MKCSGEADKQIMFRSFSDLLKKVLEKPELKIAVAEASDQTVLETMIEAEKIGLATPILVGKKEVLKDKLNSLNYSGEIIDARTPEESANIVMKLITSGKADLPMKGLLSTKIFLKILLKEEYGIKKNHLLSLIVVINLKDQERFILLSDPGMNIAPDLFQKVGIINNVVEVSKMMGISKPFAAVLAAVEKVNPAMSVTIDAAVLAKMADRGQIKDVILDGPLALDNALSPEAARKKGIKSKVAGRADILIAPDIEAGNMLYKALVFYAGLEAGSIVYGTNVPVILTSRADSLQTRLNSIVLAKFILENR